MAAAAKDRKRGEARRTEGEGVPSPTAIAPEAGTEAKERNSGERPADKARPQRRRKHEPDKR